MPMSDKKQKSRTYRFAYAGMLIALGFVLSYLESLVTLPLPAGVKLGLANIVVLMAMETVGNVWALVISLVRVILVGFTFGSMFSMIFGLSGAILSFCVMLLLKMSRKFTITGISTAGGAAHNIGQLAAAVAVIGKSIFTYLPVLLAGGIISGILIGILGALISATVKKAYSSTF
jgi:heptaprenyl diphosphate synthase